jgi:hypothetical protein
MVNFLKTFPRIFKDSRFAQRHAASRKDLFLKTISDEADCAA